MKLVSLALGAMTLIATTLGSTTPAAAGDDAFVGVQVGPLRVGAGFDGGQRRHHHRYRDYHDSGYRDCYGRDCGGFDAYRDDYMPRYDRRYSPDPWPAYWSYYGYRNYDDGNYYWYRHHRHHHRHWHHRRHHRHGDDGY